METQTKITVEATVNAPVATVWRAWNTPADIMQWNVADPSWHCPSSDNDLRIAGQFKNRMEAKDGSFGFDFEGTYTDVDPYRMIGYVMSDGRAVSTFFTENPAGTTVTTTFDAELENDVEFQKQGWQAILTNFVRYVETKY
jgi:uncharacterized protein YndB with AHSA1/START domain